MYRSVSRGRGRGGNRQQTTQSTAKLTYRHENNQRALPQNYVDLKARENPVPGDIITNYHNKIIILVEMLYIWLTFIINSAPQIGLRHSAEQAGPSGGGRQREQRGRHLQPGGRYARTSPV